METTRLLDLPLLSLDTETTGIGPRSDRIVSIGAVRLQGDSILRSTAFETLVRSGRLIPPAASAEHHISEAAVQDSPLLPDIWPQLQARMARAVVLGHHIAFDMTMLEAARNRHGLSWTPLPSLDTARRAAALDPSERSTALEDVAQRHGVESVGRHTALGDSLIVAELYLKMLPRLFRRGVATLGDATRFAASATRIVTGEREAGWRFPATLGVWSFNRLSSERPRRLTVVLALKLP